MSESNGHNGPSPDHLENLLGQLRGMAAECRRPVGKRRNRVYAAAPVKAPRQSCMICGILWDVAVVTGEPKPPLKSRCGDCKNKLVSGWTAFVTKNQLAPGALHAWVKVGEGSKLKAGQVYVVTTEEMSAIQKRFKEQNGNTAG